MKLRKSSIALLLLLVAVPGTLLITAYTLKVYPPPATVHVQPAVPAKKASVPPACVFKTVFGEEPVDSNFIYKTPDKVNQSISGALVWMAKAQLPDGGWGAGTHYRQDIMNPQAVQADPATTAMVTMALLRCNHTPTAGQYSANVNKAVNYLLTMVEKAPDKDANITTQTGTQPQIKLGANIDVVLTSQCLTNLLAQLGNNPNLQNRVKKAIEKCVVKIQRAQDHDGSIKGDGWAGVLQSSFAASALEAAEGSGIAVDTVKLARSKNFQKGNYNAADGSVKTDRGAGIVLYSVSGSGRASAKDAKFAREKVEQAKKEGKLDKDAEVTAGNLRKIGFSDDKALYYSGSYDINTAASNLATKDEVMSGFGNNGGEEYLSYLQTGEGMIVAKNTEWKKWYNNVSGKLLHVQNTDGSWNGHHCITSPVFCTATCLLILSVNNDVEHLLNL